MKKYKIISKPGKRPIVVYVNKEKKTPVKQSQIPIPQKKQKQKKHHRVKLFILEFLAFIFGMCAFFSLPSIFALAFSGQDALAAKMVIFAVISVIGLFIFSNWSQRCRFGK